MAGYDRAYYWRKAYALWPGVVRPRAARLLLPHYRARGETRNPARALLDALVGAGFLLWAGPRARRVAKRHGKDAAWTRWAARIARARFVDPNDLALFRIDQPVALDTYIRRFEDAALNKLINPRGWMPGCALADKALFAERMTAVGLPHVETLAVRRDGRWTHQATPHGRLCVAKPLLGEGGDGVRMLGEIEISADLDRWLADVVGDILVQPQLPVHPVLADLALAALPTVRIVTILDEAGRPEPVSATFRCAADPEARVDNMKAGGLIAPVALADGTLGIACQGYGGGDFASHPVTGAAIAGLGLPLWREAVAAVIVAHECAFADYALIGWDVALTPSRVRILEGNAKPGVLMPQRAARQGLAQGRYGLLLAHHLARAASPKRSKTVA